MTPPTLSTLLHKPQPELPRLLPLTNAVFQETLRYHVDTLSLRVVQDDCVIPAHLISSGVGRETGLALKAGEQVVCATRVPVVDQEEWGADAGRWDPDRFMNKEKFSGKSMNPFGGGVSMCEGMFQEFWTIKRYLRAGFLYQRPVWLTLTRPPFRLG